MKYLILYKGGEVGMENTPEAQAKMMEAWKEWFGKLGSALVTPGAPTGPSKTVTTDGVKDDVSGPKVGGYNVIEAESLESAVEMAKSSPAIQGDSFAEVYELIDMPGM